MTTMFDLDKCESERDPCGFKRLLCEKEIGDRVIIVSTNLCQQWPIVAVHLGLNNQPIPILHMIDGKSNNVPSYNLRNVTRWLNIYKDTKDGSLFTIPSNYKSRQDAEAAQTTRKCLDGRTGERVACFEVKLEAVVGDGLEKEMERGVDRDPDELPRLNIGRFTNVEQVVFNHPGQPPSLVCFAKDGCVIAAFRPVSKIVNGVLQVEAGSHIGLGHHKALAYDALLDIERRSNEK